MEAITQEGGTGAPEVRRVRRAGGLLGRAVRPGSIFAGGPGGVDPERFALVRIAPADRPPTVRLGRRGERRCEIRDGEVAVSYALQGTGWRQRVSVGYGPRVERPVGAGDVFAELSQHGAAEWAFERTKAAARAAARRGPKGRRRAAWLLGSLRAGVELEVVGLRRIQLALLAELARDCEPAELCWRSGFVSSGRPDPTGLWRAAGLKRRGAGSVARVAGYGVAESLAAAAAGLPWELGL